MCMKAAMESKLPSLAWGRQGVHLRGLILASDSAMPCQLFAKHMCGSSLADGSHLVAHARCMMHMFWTGIHRMMEKLTVVSAVFCCSTLAHKAHYLKSVSKAIRAELDRRLRCTFHPPAEAGQVGRS